MDGSRFDLLARSLAGGTSRRGFVGAMLGLGVGLAGGASTVAACPAGQVSKRGQCVCKQTGRPPTNGVCPCPKGLTDTGDGQGCLACRADAECGASDACVALACVGGACTKRKTDCDDGRGLCTTKACDPAVGCVFTEVSCDDGNACTTDACDPGVGCVHTPLVCNSHGACVVDSCDQGSGRAQTPVGDNEPGGCGPGEVCCGGACTPLGTETDCGACEDACSGTGVTCGGGGQAGVCGCTRTTTCTAGQCGTTITDNCGQSLVCPDCTVAPIAGPRTFVWTAPDGATRATFDLYGAQGADGLGDGDATGGAGGLGGRLTAKVYPKARTFQFVVGGQGSGAAGGLNGGGDGVRSDAADPDTTGGGGGGGATDVRLDGTGLDHRILVAGGGGTHPSIPGGAGGGTFVQSGDGSGADGGDVGIAPSPQGGGGGTATAGGTGGAGGTDGASTGGSGGAGILGQGGDGGPAADSTNVGGGGGGGGGYYGGGGGGDGDEFGSPGSESAGGGGSAFALVDEDVLENFTGEVGVHPGHGLATITYRFD